jgi:hypothetical protein
MIGGASLLAILLASGVPQAMEPEAPGASTPASSAPELPAFLDADSLPALQEAWQEREAATGAQQGAQQGEVPAAEQPATVPPLEQSMEAARAAMERAEKAGSDGASVRERAEELSRRFGAGATTAEPPPAAITIPPAVVTIPPAVAPAAPPAPEKRALANPEPPKRKMLAKPVTTGAVPSPDAPTLDTAVRTLDSDAGEKLRLAAPPPPSDDIPPLPRRAPKVRGFSVRPAAVENKIVTPAAQESKTIVRAKPARKASRTPSLEELRGTVLPHDLSSYGWNTKPN